MPSAIARQLDPSGRSSPDEAIQTWSASWLAFSAALAASGAAAKPDAGTPVRSSNT